MHELSPKYLKNCQFSINRYHALKKLPKGKKIAEVGVLGGDLSQWLLDNLEPSELHLIDRYNCPDYADKRRFNKNEHELFVKSRFEPEIKSERVIIKKGYSWKVLDTYPTSYFDIIYIDAAHDYYSVKKDLEASAKKINVDGYIVMNDYIMYDHLAMSRYGVVEATNEFCVKHHWEFVDYAFHPDLFCDVTLRKIQD